MDISLQGKRALVAGSTQGIGWAIAWELATMGAGCVLLARDEEKLKQRVAQLPASGAQRHGYAVADFSDSRHLKEALPSILSAGPIEILVNNTGGPAPGLLMDTEATVFLQAMEQHLVCNHLLVQALVPGMKEKKYGRIINIISTSVRIPIPRLGVSNSTRAAVASWAKTLAGELGPLQITVNNILPGYTDTQRLKSLIRTNSAQAGISEAELSQRMQEGIPLRRFGLAEEIARVAAFIASPAASYLSGTSIPVDGGSTGSL